MKTVEMLQDHTFRAKRNVHIQYRAGCIYQRVPEAAVRSITAAGAGKITGEDSDERSEP
jgi:hypothetical protein